MIMSDLGSTGRAQSTVDRVLSYSNWNGAESAGVKDPARLRGLGLQTGLKEICCPSGFHYHATVCRTRLSLRTKRDLFEPVS